jgi:hypothetical protein
MGRWPGLQSFTGMFSLHSPGAAHAMVNRVPAPTGKDHPEKAAAPSSSSLVWQPEQCTVLPTRLQMEQPRKVQRQALGWPRSSGPIPVVRLRAKMLV